MLAQPANTTCTSDKVFFTTLYRTFEGLFTSFLPNELFPLEISNGIAPTLDYFKTEQAQKTPASSKQKPG